MGKSNATAASTAAATLLKLAAQTRPLWCRYLPSKNPATAMAARTAIVPSCLPRESRIWS